MSTALQVVSTGQGLTPAGQGTNLPALLSTQEEIDLLKESVARDQQLTDSELSLFVHVCRHRGLNPFARQIYAIRRKGKIVHQTSIDGFRLIADRTGRYAPGRDATYRYKDNGSLLSATSYVKKLVGGVWHEVAETAYWDEFYPGKRDGFMWDKMPHVMLAKVAEAQALRRAFPEDLSGLYTSDEMAQAGGGDYAESEVVSSQQQAHTPTTQRSATSGASSTTDSVPGFDFAAARAKIEKRIGEEATPEDYLSVLKQCEAFVEKWPESEKALTVEIIDMGRVILEKRIEAADRSLEHLRMLFDKADETPSGTFDLEHERLLNHLGKVAKPWPEVWQVWLKERYEALVSQYDFWDEGKAEAPREVSSSPLSEPALPREKRGDQVATEAASEPTLEDVQESMRAGKLNKYGLQALLRDYEVQHLNKLSASLYASVIALMRDVSQVAHLNRTGLQYEITQSYKAVKTLKEADTKFSAWQQKTGKLYANNDIAAEKVMDHLGKVHEACLKRLGVQSRGHAPQASLL